MNDQFNADFYYKGKRAYVHGTTMFDRFLTALDSLVKNSGGSGQPVIISQVKFIKEITNNGYIETYPFSDDNETALSDAATAEMTCLIGLDRFILRLYEDPERPVTERAEDIDSTFIKYTTLSKEFSGRAIMHNVNNISSFTAGLIRANKNLHTSTLKDSEGLYSIRWVYMKNLPFLPDNTFPSEINVDIQHHGAKAEADLTYTLNSLKYKIADKDYRTQICFYYTKGKA